MYISRLGNCNTSLFSCLFAFSSFSLFNFLGVSEWVFPGFSHTTIPKVQRSIYFVVLEKSKMLNNEYLFAIVAVDTAENEPLEAWG